MQFEAKTQKVTFQNPLSYFEFSDSVSQALVGISELFYIYGNYGDNDDNRVQEINAFLGQNIAHNSVTVNAHMMMRDGSGNSLGGQSFIQVGCVAAIGSDSNDNATLVSGLNFNSRENSGQIRLDNSIYQSISVLSGFKMYYGNGDQNIKDIYTIAYPINMGNNAMLSGLSGMSDGGGNASSKNYVSGSYVGTYIKGAESGLVLAQANYRTHFGPSASYNLGSLLNGKKLTGAAVFVTGFGLFYGVGHHVNYIRVGVDSVSVDSGNSTVNYSPYIQMQDGSGNKGDGYVNVLIVGTVKI